jgi:hypothetical protein
LYHRGTLPLADFFEVGQRAFSVIEIFFCEQKRGLADTDLVALSQRGLPRYFSIVDYYTVLAVHIFGVMLFCVLIISYSQMLARDHIIKYLHGKGLGSSYHIRASAERQIFAFLLSGYYDNRSHYNSFL